MFLPVASGAAGQLLNSIFFHEFFTEGGLIRRRYVRHVKNVFARTNETLGCPMALQAPIHIKSIFAPRERHHVDPAVTGRATDALMDMNAVIEVNEAGKVMNPSPLN